MCSVLDSCTRLLVEYKKHSVFSDLQIHFKPGQKTVQSNSFFASFALKEDLEDKDYNADGLSFSSIFFDRATAYDVHPKLNLVLTLDS